MGVNEGNCISCYLSNHLENSKSCCSLLVPCLPFANTHASRRIGSDTTSLENEPTFYEDNLSSSLNQGKHLTSSLNRILLNNILLFHDCALKYRSFMKP
jgi:hypothetical protein